MPKPQTFFLIVGFIFGLTFLILTPPFQVPDEPNHFYRAWQIASGQLFPTKQDNRLGSFMPKSLIKAVNAHLDIKGNPYAKTSFKNIREQLQIKLDDKTLEFVDFPNTALYTPISYLPQAISIAVFKLLGFSPVWILYFTRLTVLFLWLLVVYRVIKMLPIFKWFFTFSALLPMCVFINMSVSADVITNLLGFLWIGNVFKFAFGGNLLRKQQMISLFLLAIFIASAKYVYTPIVFLIFLIPTRKFPKTRFFKSYGLHVCVILLAFLVAFIGSRYASKTYISNASYNQSHLVGLDVPYGTDINGQIKYLKDHPKKISEVVYKGFIHSFEMLQTTYIGVLGWLDVHISSFFIYLSYLSLFLILLKENYNSKFIIKIWQRFIIFSIGILLMFLIYLSQYLSWAGVGSEYCGGIQGRYFITVLPLVFLGLIFVPFKHKIILPFSIIASLLILLIFVKSLYDRFLLSPPKYTEIYCDAEKMFKDDYMGETYFKTDKPDIVASNGVSISNEKAHSGTHSSKTSNESPWGATFRLFNNVAGDTVTTEVWYYGNGGILWMSSNAGKVFISQNMPIETDEKGWKKLVSKIIIDKNMEGNEIDIFVESRQPCFFDDFKLSVHEARK